jgi:hypothetical protein
MDLGRHLSTNLRRHLFAIDNFVGFCRRRCMLLFRVLARSLAHRRPCDPGNGRDARTEKFSTLDHPAYAAATPREASSWAQFAMAALNLESGALQTPPDSVSEQPSTVEEC